MISIPKPSKKSLLIIRLHLISWFLLVIAMLVLMIYLWIYVRGSQVNTSAEKESEESIDSVKTVHVNKTIPKLKDLTSEVAPIEFETIVRDMRSYPDEFKDRVYINKRKGKWTIEVMNVTEHQIIIDYLDGRKDRNNFAYFRFTDENSKLRYILMYGEMKDSNEAMAVASKVDFKLPSSIRVMPEEMNRYISIVDNYERGEAVLDMSKNRPRSIRLQKTRYEVPVKRIRPKQTESIKKFNSQIVEKNNVQSLANAPVNNLNFQGGVIDKSTRQQLPSSDNTNASQNNLGSKQSKLNTSNSSSGSVSSDKQAKPFIPNSPPNQE